MKKIFLTTLLGASLLAGCTRHYIVTLDNGTQLSVYGKPKLSEDGGAYIFKDAGGQPVKIQKGRVNEITPASMAGPGFNNPSSK